MPPDIVTSMNAFKKRSSTVSWNSWEASSLAVHHPRSVIRFIELCEQWQETETRIRI